MNNRTYCQSCNNFLINIKKTKEHSDIHGILKNITDEMLNHPLEKILKPIEINSSNAVRFHTHISKYLFNNKNLKVFFLMFYSNSYLTI
jgi:hypothetical protein